jgi:hypothetical protein
MESWPSQRIRLRTLGRTYLEVADCPRINLIGSSRARLLNCIRGGHGDINSSQFPLEAVMTEEENQQENWSRLLKWLAVIAVIALLVFTSFFLRVSPGEIE